MPRCTLVKKSKRIGSVKRAKPGAGAVDFQLQDNEDGTFTIFGTDTAGDQIDISAVASLTPVPVSDNPAVLSVDPPNGMTDAVHGLSAGLANITIVATWTDGSVGPFTIVAPVTVVAAPPPAVTGLLIQWGVPTVR